MSERQRTAITLSPENCNDSVFALMGCPKLPVRIKVIVTNECVCDPYLDLRGFVAGSDIEVINYGHLGPAQPDKNMIPNQFEGVK